MIKYSNELSQLLFFFLKVTDFSRLRLYVVDKTRHTAMLWCAIDKENGPINKADEYKEMHKIPLNLRKLYKKEKCDHNKFRDFIVRFREQVPFMLNLSDFEDVPDEVKRFHDEHGISQIAVVPIWIGDENFIGYIAVDKSLNDSGLQKISKGDVAMLGGYMSLMSQTIIDVLYKIEADEQRNVLLNKSQELMERLDKGGYKPDGIMRSLMESIFQICKQADIVQIKQIIGDAKRYKCLYIMVNPDSDILPEERERLALLEGMEFDLDEEKDWVTIEVHQTQTSKLIPDTRDANKEKIKEAVKSGDKLDPKNIILKRCLSEVNVPFRFGGGQFGVIDVHGRRPFTLNKNTLSILRDIAPWVSVILNERNYNISYNFSDMKKRLVEYLNETNDKNNKGAGYNVGINIYNNVFNYFDGRDMTNYINYENHKKFIIEYKSYVDGEFLYKSTRSFSKLGITLSVAALPITLIPGAVIFYPFLAGLGIISSLLFKKMAKNGLKKYKEANSGKLAQINNLVEGVE